jgi:hypothetical protein
VSGGASLVEAPRVPSNVEAAQLNASTQKVDDLVRDYLSRQDLYILAAPSGHEPSQDPRPVPQVWDEQRVDAQQLDATGVGSMDVDPSQSSSTEEASAVSVAAAALHEDLSSCAPQAAIEEGKVSGQPPGEGSVSAASEAALQMSTDAKKAQLAKTLQSRKAMVAVRSYGRGALSRRGLLLELGKASKGATAESANRVK